MKIIKGNDFQILERLISLNQAQTQKTVSHFLKSKYPKVVETKDYIYAEGEIPVALVAHMDTVFEKDKYHKRNNLFYDIQKGVMWNPYGAGFDDKAGVFAILKIIRDGYKPHVIFTTDEEVGGVGATILTEKEKESPFTELKYVIELDRANEVDCVFYDCYNEEFIDYIESFGFIEAWGTFSDIDVICSEWRVAGVNLSIGYKDEHTASETLYVNAMLTTIEKVKKMLNCADKAKTYEYIPSPYLKSYYPKYYQMYYGNEFGYDLVKCEKCGHLLNEYDGIPVKSLDGKTVYYCCDCIASEDIGWCRDCGEAFERKNHSEYYCQDCRDGGTTCLGTKSKKKSKQ